MVGFAGQIGDALNAPGLFAQAAALGLLSAMWQGAAIAVGVAVCLRLAPRMAAAHRFALWSGAFAILLVLPGLPYLTQLVGAHEMGYASPIASARHFLTLDPRWSFAIVLLWAAASLYRAVDLGVDSVRLRRLWRSAAPVEIEANSHARLESAGRKRIEICSTTELDRPGVIGFFAPRILIPEWLLERLSAAELDQVVLHEMEHLRRGDDWTNLLHKVGLILFPLNPALVWIERRLCREREMACDEAVVRITGAPRAYAAALTSLAERGLHRRLAMSALSLGAWQRRPELARRIHSILLRKRTIGPLAARGLMAGLSTALILGAVGLANSPQLIGFAPASAEPVVAAVHSDLNSAAIGNEAGSYARPRLTNLKAVMPTKPSIALHLPTKPSGHELAKARVSPQEPVMADATPVEAEPPQQWLVMTRWEEIVTAPAAGASETDYAQSDSEIAPQRSPAGRDRVTVTRLIFKVMPLPTQVVQVRGGWIVFQL
jgi:beta-lactamase regulating signal transducer with metallopeptidase domain